jgi:hypothetical protein
MKDLEKDENYLLDQKHKEHKKLSKK